MDNFRDRVLLYETDEVRNSYAVTAGSALGSILWNATYYGVLRLRLLKSAQIFRFAVDIALVVSGETSCWIGANIGLKLADYKIDVVLLSSTKKMEYITITVGEQKITSKQSIKYLGVMIDNRLTFKEYLSRKCAALLRG